jgi:hypothetical protein
MPGLVADRPVVLINIPQLPGGLRAEPEVIREQVRGSWVIGKERLLEINHKGTVVGVYRGTVVGVWKVEGVTEAADGGRWDFTGPMPELTEFAHLVGVPPLYPFTRGAQWPMRVISGEQFRDWDDYARALRTPADDTTPPVRVRLNKAGNHEIDLLGLAPGVTFVVNGDEIRIDDARGTDIVSLFRAPDGSTKLKLRRGAA